MSRGYKYSKESAAPKVVPDATQFNGVKVNFIENSYFCRIYKCEKRVINTTGYCEEHCSDLRPGLPPLARGSSPVKKRK